MSESRAALSRTERNWAWSPGFALPRATCLLGPVGVETRVGAFWAVHGRVDSCHIRGTAGSISWEWSNHRLQVGRAFVTCSQKLTSLRSFKATTNVGLPQGQNGCVENLQLLVAASKFASGRLQTRPSRNFGSELLFTYRLLALERKALPHGHKEVPRWTGRTDRGSTAWLFPGC